MCEDSTGEVSNKSNKFEDCGVYRGTKSPTKINKWNKCIILIL